jgi:serine/threonine protein kinase
MGNGDSRVTDPASSSTSKNDYSFGQLAIRENLCTFEQVKEGLDIQTKLRGLGIEPKKLGDILIEKGYLTADQAAQVVKLQSAAAPAAGAKLQIPGYEILGRIGQGAMGSVYKAKQVSMDRIVAVKVLAGRYSKDRSFVERFLREARAVAKLNHENVISGIDVGELNGFHYFVMEFVDGAPASSLLKKEGKLSEKRCLEIGQHVARALAHAHKHGIVHRDVKPENVMITTAGVAKLCDLGLAKQAKGDAGATMDGQSVGTPNYISPEQARGEENIDIRSDIYSLGCTLYHMAVGATPFDGPNPMVVMTKHVTEWAEPPKKRNPALSEGFNALIQKMMQKRREDRPQDPEAVLAAIESLLRGGPLPGAAPATRVPPATRIAESPTHRPHRTSTVRALASKSSSMPLIVGGVAVAVVVVGFLAFRGGGGDATPPPPKPPVVGGGSTKPPPPPPDVSGDGVKSQIESFRQVAYPELEREARADRFTWAYGTLQKKIELAKANADTVALKAWMD